MSYHDTQVLEALQEIAKGLKSIQETLEKQEEKGEPLATTESESLDTCPHCGSTARIVAEPGEPNGGFAGAVIPALHKQGFPSRSKKQGRVGTSGRGSRTQAFRERRWSMNSYTARPLIHGERKRK